MGPSARPDGQGRCHCRMSLASSQPCSGTTKRQQELAGPTSRCSQHREYPSVQSLRLSWTGSLQALCHLLDGRAWDIEWLLGPCRVLEEGKPCLATTKFSPCHTQHSHPASNPIPVPLSGKKGSPVKSRTVGTFRQFLRKSSFI